MYLLNYPNFRLETVVYLLSPDGKEVLYLHKNKPTERTHNKLIGFGGKFERGENEYQCAKREVKEELGFELRNSIYSQGLLILEDSKKAVFVMKTRLETRISEQYVKDEGEAVYRPIDHYVTNPQKFLETDLIFLEKLLKTNKKFKVII